MDARILQKLHDIKQKEDVKKEQERLIELQHEERRQKEIIERLPEARNYVEKVLLDQIAQSINKGSKEFYLSPYNLNFIPIESIVQAVSEIDGLKIRKEWTPERTDHFLSDETMDTIPAHYEYYVMWSK